MACAVTRELPWVCMERSSEATYGFQPGCMGDSVTPAQEIMQVSTQKHQGGSTWHLG